MLSNKLLIEDDHGAECFGCECRFLVRESFLFSLCNVYVSALLMC